MKSKHIFAEITNQKAEKSVCLIEENYNPHACTPARVN